MMGWKAGRRGNTQFVFVGRDNFDHAGGAIEDLFRGPREFRQNVFKGLSPRDRLENPVLAFEHADPMLA